jgi:RNA polymerase sigma factor, sigma-70 family
VDFEELYNLNSKYVYRYIFSLCKDEHTANDILSETFYRAICSADKFRGDCSVRVWLCQIAKNLYFNFAKKNKLTTELSDELRSGENLEARLVNKSQAFEIHRALHLLNEPYKEVFSLRLFSELSFSDIGELFGKSESWARVTFYRAKNKIREDVSDD